MVQASGRSHAAIRLEKAGWGLVIATVLLTACGAPSTSVTQPPVATTGATTVPAPVDLTDPSIQARLGSPPFEGVRWERSVGPFRAVGDAALPDPDQLALMRAAVEEIPAMLRTAPRALVRTDDTGLAPDHAAAHAVALARGPDVYLLDPVFGIDGSTSRLQLAYALTHELVHVEQWYSLDLAYVTAALGGRVAAIRLDEGSTSVREFAAGTGWVDQDPGEFSAEWVLDPEAVPASAYGAVGPAEDMAETVSLAASGRLNWLDASRQSWLRTWLGADPAELGEGKPWIPAGSTEVLSADALYDQAAVAALVDGSSHIEPAYFELPADVADADTLASAITAELEARSLTGSMAPVADDRVVRRGGSFVRSDGAVFWVELWDFRASDLDQKPERPILAYVMIW